MATGRIPINGTAAIQSTIVDAKGDLIAATADNAVSRLAVGANGTTLVADSSTATGLAYRADTVNTVVDAKGDLLVATADNTIARLAVGANDTILVAASGETTGLKWAAPASSSPASASAEVQTNQNTGSTSFTNLTTVGPAVTITTGTKALVFLNCDVRNFTEAQQTNVSFEVSGASSVAPSVNFSFGSQQAAGAYFNRGGKVYRLTGLTAGSNTFTMKYSVNGGTGVFENRSIIVMDLGS